MAVAKTDYVKLEYQILDLVEYNGLKITGNMKILLSLIYSYEKNVLTYYESVPTLGKRLGLEPQATRSLIAKLCTAGMISYDERKGSSHIFHSKLLNQELMILIGEEKPKKNGKPVSEKSEDKQVNDKSEQAKPQAEQGKRIDQNVGLAAGSAPDASEQRSGVAANDDNGRNDRDGGNHEMKQEEQPQQEDKIFENDRPFPPEKPASDDAPWHGMTFGGDGRLSEAAYKWALTAGAADWRHACRLVWEKVGVTPLDEINEDRKPKFLMQRTN